MSTGEVRGSGGVYGAGEANINDFYTQTFKENGVEHVILGYVKDLGKGTKVKNYFSFSTFRYGEEAEKHWAEACQNTKVNRYVNLGALDPRVAAFASRHFEIAHTTFAKQMGDLTGWIDDKKL